MVSKTIYHGDNWNGEDPRVRVSLSTPTDRAILAAARNTSWSGFPGERGRKSRFCFVLVDSAYRHGRAGLRFMWQHIFKASLTIWPYWTFGTPTRRNDVVKDDFVGRLGFRKCRVSPKLCAKNLLFSLPIDPTHGTKPTKTFAFGQFWNFHIIASRFTFLSSTIKMQKRISEERCFKFKFYSKIEKF